MMTAEAGNHTAASFIGQCHLLWPGKVSTEVGALPSGTLTFCSAMQMVTERAWKETDQRLFLLTYAAYPELCGTVENMPLALLSGVG